MSDLADAPEQWPVHQVEDVWRGHAPFAVRRDTIWSPRRPEERFGRLVIEHPGAAIVLAVDDDERALVIQQYRHPAGLRFVELPAGLVDVPGEDPLVTARRELLEEGAHTAAEWTHLLTTYPTPGLSSERHDYCLARGLRHGPDRAGFELVHEEAELTVSWVPVEELVQGVLDGRLTDGPLVVAVAVYRLRGF